MYIGWRRLVLAAAGLGVAGFVFAWSGLFNVAASSGHWPGVGPFLHWVMINSVRTHARGIEAPSLEDAALVARGAGHYATGCAPCHGAPGVPQSPVVRHMSPPAPTLPEKIPTWKDRELFWIVQHGVKYSAMPAWTTQDRGDEVWSMVAFLRRMPGMDAQNYRRAAYGTEAPGDRARLATCAACHGRDGLGRDGHAFPIIAGQNEAYLLAALRAYAEGARHSGIMEPAAGRLTDAALTEVAAHYAAQPFQPAPTPFPIDPERQRLGERIAREGLPADGVPACDGCHGPGERNPHYPRIGGQHADYLARQLTLWASGGRGGSAYAPLMQTSGHRLKPDQIQAVSDHYAARR